MGKTFESPQAFLCSQKGWWGIKKDEGLGLFELSFMKFNVCELDGIELEENELVVRQLKMTLEPIHVGSIEDKGHRDNFSKICERARVQIIYLLDAFKKVSNACF